MQSAWLDASRQLPGGGDVRVPGRRGGAAAGRLSDRALRCPLLPAVLQEHGQAAQTLAGQSTAINDRMLKRWQVSQLLTNNTFFKRWAGESAVIRIPDSF